MFQRLYKKLLSLKYAPHFLAAFFGLCVAIMKAMLLTLFSVWGGAWWSLFLIIIAIYAGCLSAVFFYGEFKHEK